MAKLIWLALLVFCLLAVQAKKHEKAHPKSADADTPAAEADPPAEDPEAPETEDAADPSSDQESATAAPEEEQQADAKSETKEEDKDDKEEKNESPEDASSSESEKEDDNKPEAEDESEAVEKKEFTCNLKFKKVGCFADKKKANKPLKSFIMSDSEIEPISKKGKLPKEGTYNAELPKFVCKCANEAMKSGNAVFGIQNLAECWSGPDDSKYDQDGKSDNCVAFDYKPCSDESQICAGKKHANFIYYVDSPEHTKTPEEIKKELEADAKKKKENKKKATAAKKLAKKLSKKKSKKSKKAKQ